MVLELRGAAVVGQEGRRELVGRRGRRRRRFAIVPLGRLRHVRRLVAQRPLWKKIEKLNDGQINFSFYDGEVLISRGAHSENTRGLKTTKMRMQKVNAIHYGLSLPVDPRRLPAV